MTALDPGLLAIVVCPACHGALSVVEGAAGAPDDVAAELVCGGECGRAYPVRDDIPVLLVDEARLP
ncbi:Trm112 family protein [Nocardioides bruguierae]|uniref:Trm112 family protein n=1 Tax=Nocardioides bruguierae TaxID=2945102 RepID=A0A9X2IEI0_9ACTN|nr:Trm112 family protein [Nocardioides bruguierae]MCL8024971.1 Trm112 family protein [Nocardioides bruguierae]MCM0619374.1 Trm112 family protein [Nocardioides bruguierae]